jgi:hypothetical protein
MAENPSTTIESGAQFVVPHPFCWDLASRPSGDEGGPYMEEFMSWRPGVRFEVLPPGDDSESVADGMGSQALTVVSVHKPGKYPARVFYVRQWIDPRGSTFGKTKLRITTAGAFKSLIRGYRHEFRLVTGEEFAEHEAEERAKASPRRSFTERAALADGGA